MMNTAEEKKYGQGVISIISFPLGQDEIAVSKAIQELLRDGWKFDGLEKDKINFRRTWEA